MSLSSSATSILGQSSNHLVLLRLEIWVLFSSSANIKSPCLCKQGYCNWKLVAVFWSQKHIDKFCPFLSCPLIKFF
ncbi:hypothetical protein SCLCIDRAFT_1144293 [Scleroderma citrinum Foug A]|uniref:Uncharacterized protein n=1 Tax=Scleroderma citrinum Foug A TaxID=1036808 RepID=A0A0C2ZWN4_9AGAM|nr:hypothetical protein SCLCIDRAFT_1144293 [Scleroderma citrinum Foug A]